MFAERFIVGWSDLGYAQGASHFSRFTNLKQFRAFAISTLGLNSMEMAVPHKPTILMLKKDVNHALKKLVITNADEVLKFLRNTYPGANIQTASWAGMSTRDQVKTVMQADIVISLPGSDMMNLLFLPSRHATRARCPRTVPGSPPS